MPVFVPVVICGALAAAFKTMESTTTSKSLFMTSEPRIVFSSRILEVEIHAHAVATEISRQCRERVRSVYRTLGCSIQRGNTAGLSCLNIGNRSVPLNIEAHIHAGRFLSADVRHRFQPVVRD